MQSWVWFDFENTPHVLFLEPILRRLQGEGWATRATARRQGQTVELAARHQITVESIGRGDLESTAGKAIGGVGSLVAARARQAARLDTIGIEPIAPARSASESSGVRYQRAV